MTIREHLKDLHQTSADHHIKMAKAHKKMAAHYEKAEGMDGASDLADSHSMMADHHTAMADYHVECCKTLMNKAMGLDLDLGDKLVPDNVHGILREFPGTSTLVPRAGQPAAPAMPNVPSQFQKLVSVEDEEN